MRGGARAARICVANRIDLQMLSLAGGNPRGVDGPDALRSRARQCGVCPPPEPSSPREAAPRHQRLAAICRDAYEGMDRSTAIRCLILLGLEGGRFYWQLDIRQVCMSMSYTGKRNRKICDVVVGAERTIERSGARSTSRTLKKSFCEGLGV